MSEQIPERHVLPIACDCFGNIFCLELVKDSYGKVMYSKLASENKKFYDVAQDFDAFLENIYPWIEGREISRCESACGDRRSPDEVIFSRGNNNILSRDVAS